MVIVKRFILFIKPSYCMFFLMPQFCAASEKDAKEWVEHIDFLIKGWTSRYSVTLWLASIGFTQLQYGLCTVCFATQTWVESYPRMKMSMMTVCLPARQLYPHLSMMTSMKSSLVCHLFDYCISLIKMSV